MANENEQNKPQVKGYGLFKEKINEYLQWRAESDELFAPRLANENKNLDECCEYIMGEVAKSGRSGFDDEEIYNFAVHYYDEDDIKVEKFNGQGHIISNCHVELSEEEKAEARRKAVEELKNREIARMTQKNTPKPKTTTTNESDKKEQEQLSLF